jgi:hypothetical protein
VDDNRTPHRRHRPKDPFDLWASLAVALLIDPLIGLGRSGRRWLRHRRSRHRHRDREKSP